LRDAAVVSDTLIIPRYSSDFFFGRCNDSNPQGDDTANANGTGHYVANRSGSLSTNTQLYRNAVSMTPSAPTASAAVQNGNIYILAQNLLGTGATGGSAAQCCQSSIGDNFSSTDVTNFYNVLRTYMTAVGVP
jgi:hypothetical protein